MVLSDDSKNDILKKIEEILSRGNIVEIFRLKHDITIIERKQIKRISVPVEVRE